MVTWPRLHWPNWQLPIRWNCSTSLNFVTPKPTFKNPVARTSIRAAAPTEMTNLAWVWGNQRIRGRFSMPRTDRERAVKSGAGGGAPEVEGPGTRDQRRWRVPPPCRPVACPASAALLPSRPRPASSFTRGGSGVWCGLSWNSLFWTETPPNASCWSVVPCACIVIWPIGFNSL